MLLKQGLRARVKGSAPGESLRLSPHPRLLKKPAKRLMISCAEMGTAVKSFRSLVLPRNPPAQPSAGRHGKRAGDAVTPHRVAGRLHGALPDVLDRRDGKGALSLIHI